MFLFWFLYIYHHRLVNHSDQYFFESSILVQMVFYFSNSFSLSTLKNINLIFLFSSPFLTLNVLTYPLILSNIKTNGLITLSKYQIKYLELVLFSTNFVIIMVSTLTSQIFFTIMQKSKLILKILCLEKKY